MTMDEQQPIVGRCIAALDAITRRSPRVQCVMNSVAMNYVANALLAIRVDVDRNVNPEALLDRVALSLGDLAALGSTSRV